jgi:DNA-binding NarL/FixJ family response regulator
VENPFPLGRLRVVLAEDNSEFLQKIARLLGPFYEVVARVGDGQSLVDAVSKLKPQIVVTDISMPGLTGIEAASKLNESGCNSKIIFLTVHNDADYVRTCLATGAYGYVTKARMNSDLLHAIREALEERVFVSSGLRK